MHRHLTVTEPWVPPVLSLTGLLPEQDVGSPQRVRGAVGHGSIPNATEVTVPTVRPTAGTPSSTRRSGELQCGQAPSQHGVWGVTTSWARGWQLSWAEVPPSIRIVPSDGPNLLPIGIIAVRARQEGASLWGQRQCTQLEHWPSQ